MLLCSKVQKALPAPLRPLALKIVQDRGQLQREKEGKIERGTKSITQSLSNVEYI